MRIFHKVEIGVRFSNVLLKAPAYLIQVVWRIGINRCSSLEKEGSRAHPSLSVHFLKFEGDSYLNL